MRLNTTYCMLYVLIFNKPFLANLVSSKNVYACLNACIFVNMASKCAWHIYQNLSWIWLSANKLVLVSLLFQF